MSHESKFNNHMQNELWVRALAAQDSRALRGTEARMVAGRHFASKSPLGPAVERAADPTCSQGWSGLST